MSQQSEITWGALEFVHPETAPPAAGYLVQAMAEDSHFDNPKALVQVVKSLLTDGSLAVIEGWDNRECPIRLRISAPSATAGPALAEAEAVLMAQLQADSKAPLLWTPPASGSATNVFDVVAASLERDNSQGWDLEEQLREYRYYTLTLTCLPFARTANRVVVPAIPLPPPSPTTVDIDACTSTTGWSALNTTVATAGGYVEAGPSGVKNGRSYFDMTRTGSVSMGATPYLRVTAQLVDTATATTLPLALSATTNTGSAALVATAPSSLVSGATDVYFQPGATLTLMRFYAELLSGGVVATARLRIHHVARTDTIPGAGTNRQRSRAVTVRGSARTQAAIRLFDATTPTPAALGTDILVHTSSNTDWRPALRPYRVSGPTVTADATMVSGARESLSGSPSTVYRIPARLLTEGTYALMARGNVTPTAVVGWSARIVSAAGATTVGSSVVVSGTTTPAGTGGAYRIFNLALLSLPVVRAEADQMVEISINMTSIGPGSLLLDEAWLFGLHDGVLTWLGDSDSLTWIEIRSPELGAARPSVYGGTGTKGTNPVCIDWKCLSFGAHRFTPGAMQIYTVTSTSVASQSEIEFYPRGHSHVQTSWT
ncbi:hypothetical protein [Pimelobacter simplex]|uniref:hypothetical protein n=1 Tax=Nocardioides simplex TaxID=2045 RepID=UPI00214F8787|nr:hypothetical protein [Pimelobacter simplex]UUW88406.1 hypothetical protein M0M43_22040 [Pimelobacter simplex]UUW97910.1 hypothetical protein M0M48_10685 [Pimelobacter simplex]